MFRREEGGGWIEPTSLLSRGKEEEDGLEEVPGLLLSRGEEGGRGSGQPSFSLGGGGLILKEPWTIEVFVCGVLFVLEKEEEEEAVQPKQSKSVFYKHDDNTRIYMISFFE